MQVGVAEPFPAIGVASAKKDHQDGDCGESDLDAAAHVERIGRGIVGPNSTDVLS